MTSLLVVSFLIFGWSSSQIIGGMAAMSGGAQSLYVSMAALIWLGCFLATTTIAYGSPYLFANAYVLALFVFHFGLIVQDAFGIIPVGLYGTEQGKWILLGGWYVNLAFASIGLGFSLSCLLARRPRSTMLWSEQERLATWNLRRLRNIGIGLTAASGVFLAIGVAQIGNILSYDRFKLFFGTIDNRGLQVFLMVAPSAVLAMVISARTLRGRRWGLFMAILATLLVLFSGNRSMALFPFLTGVVLWAKTGRMIPLPIALTALIGALLIVPIFGALRDLGSYETLSMEKLADASEGASISKALAELGGSVGALATTLRYVPADEPFRYGMTYIRSLRDIIPNIGSQRDRSEDPAAALAGGSLNEAMLRMTPAQWAAVKQLGVRAAIYQNYGVGFSGVAEPYFNFGFIGVFVFFTGLGFLLSRLDSINILLSYPHLFFSTLIFWQLLLTVRNEFGTSVKPAAFVLICLGIWWLLRRFTPFARI